MSILGIGISIGGVVEYYLVTRDLKNREQIYNHNIDAISKSLEIIEGRVKTLHMRISNTTNEIRVVQRKIEKFDPESTQIIDAREIRKRNTPSAPFTSEVDDKNF